MASTPMLSSAAMPLPGTEGPPSAEVIWEPGSETANCCTNNDKPISPAVSEPFNYSLHEVISYIML